MRNPHTPQAPSCPPGRIGSYLVLQERHEVLFRDDTVIGLHQVTDQQGVPQLFLRCFLYDELHAMLIDLRHLRHSLASELPCCPARDVQGLVMMTLRLAYAGADEFRAAALAVVRHAALLPDPEPVQRSLQFFSSSGPVDFLGPENGDRRFWPATLPKRERSYA
ncbi:UNVERIFIED_ORG: hypothetical protein LHJ69_12750 [Shinella sp. XGS7]|nr:hypothetical protein [Shinella sp. XGS7]